MSTQRKHDLIFGYINAIQQSLPSDNCYFNITLPIRHLCASYIYWYGRVDEKYNGTSEIPSFLHRRIKAQQAILENTMYPAADEITKTMIRRFSVFYTSL